MELISFIIVTKTSREVLLSSPNVHLVLIQNIQLISLGSSYLIKTFNTRISWKKNK